MTGANGSVKRILYYLLIFAAGVAAVTMLAVKGLAQYIVFTLPMLVYPIYKLVEMHRKTLRKITYLFNAVASNDYNFGFGQGSSALKGSAPQAKAADSTVLNYSLNNIRDILAYNHKKSAERERYYELIEQNVSTGILTLYPDGAVYKVNREALKLLGVEYMAHINYLRGIDASLAKALVEIRKGETKRINVRSESGEVSLLVNASEFRMEETLLKVITINDINRALDEKELESWIKFTRILTHEIMNSLAPIVSLSDSLIETNRGLEVEDGANGSDSEKVAREENRQGLDNENSARMEIAKGLEIINDTGKGLVKFVEQYRKFTRLQTPVKEPFEIKPLLERNLSLVCGSAGAVQCSLEVEPADILVYADSDLVSLAVVNILKNAVSAVEAVGKRQIEGEDGGERIVGKRNEIVVGKIEVRVYIDDNENVVIDISNNGGAVEREIVEDIFLPFFTTKENGSGIGLSVAKQIMYLHGGELKLACNTDENVTFRLIFP